MTVADDVHRRFDVGLHAARTCPVNGCGEQYMTQPAMPTTVSPTSSDPSSRRLTRYDAGNGRNLNAVFQTGVRHFHAIPRNKLCWLCSEASLLLADG